MDSTAPDLPPIKTKVVNRKKKLKQRQLPSPKEKKSRLLNVSALGKGRFEFEINQDDDAAECQFCSFYSVQNHTRNHLLGYQIAGPKKRHWDADQFYGCSHCSQQIKTRAGIKRHEMLHLVKGRYQCSSCSFSVSTRFHLSRHITIAHSDGRKMSSEEESFDVLIDVVNTLFLNRNYNSFLSI